MFLGELQSLKIRLETGQPLWLRRFADPVVPLGEQVRVGWRPERLRILSRS
jgi:hypothetical protein